MAARLRRTVSTPTDRQPRRRNMASRGVIVSDVYDVHAAVQKHLAESAAAFAALFEKEVGRARPSRKPRA